jgi:PAT family beta-lactamase induction signal transducer AmpG
MTALWLVFEGYWGELSFLYVAAVLAAITRYGLLTLVAAVAMSICDPRVSATQFTLYLAFTNLGMAMSAGVVGALNQFGGFVACIWVCGIASVLALGITAFFDPKAPKQDELHA